MWQLLKILLGSPITRALSKSAMFKCWQINSYSSKHSVILCCLHFSLKAVFIYIICTLTHHHYCNFLGGWLCVPAEIQSWEMWWHPQVEAPQSQLGGLSPQDYQSRRRGVSHCCQGNALPDEFNSTYHFVTHMSTLTHPYTRKHTYSVCVKSMLFIGKTECLWHWFFFSCISFLPWGSVSLPVTLLPCEEVYFFYYHHLHAAFVCNNWKLLFTACIYMW